MEHQEAYLSFFNTLEQSIEKGDFIQMTLGKAASKQEDLQKIFVKNIKIKQENQLSFTYRHQTKDVVKNFTFDTATEELKKWLGHHFLHIHLFTEANDFQLLFNKKRKARFLSKKASMQAGTKTHDKIKKRWIEAQPDSFLVDLAVCNKEGKVLHAMQDKFKQINRYIEIIDGLIKNTELPETFHIVDMGSGKGYLTFALYDYLKNTRQINCHITGIELRPHLVDQCNKIAKKHSFDDLHFVAQDIHSYEDTAIDMLIALHACDTATDDAIYKGLCSKSTFIVCAPCCHKQVRNDMKCESELQAIIKHGIFEERQAEMLTDGIRALLMESEGYQSKIFEFISNEHTRKNVMLIGKRTKENNQEEKLKQVATLKDKFGIESHYLEQLMHQ